MTTTTNNTTNTTPTTTSTGTTPTGAAAPGRRAVHNDGPWFNYVTRRDQPTLRLLCVGGAGSGPSEFVHWNSRLPDHTDIWPVQLPGRERRVRETPSQNLAALVVGVHRATENSDTHPRLPLVLFGHSFGALIMFELARRITAADPDRVHGIILSGLGAPIRAVRPLALSHLDDAALLEWTTGELGGTPAELLNDDRFKRWLLQDLRAAEGIRENYTVGDHTPLHCPVVAIGGEGDPETTNDDLDAWAQFTTGTFQRHLLPGGHFFLRQERDAILTLIADTLTTLNPQPD